MSAPVDRRAWGWVAHLRAGGTTPWLGWTGDGEEGGRHLPGAQQLELLRRINQTARPSAALATRVLEASAPGRGRPDLELVGAVEPLRFGPPPVDPGALPVDELLRVASGLVADDVVAAGTPDPPTPKTPRPWRTRYRLAGDPWLTEPMREALLARGRPPGGRGAVVVVVGTDLGTLLADAWTARSFSLGGPSWSDFLGSGAAHRRLPPRADLVRLARFWADRVGRGRVRIVLDPAAVPRLVGVRRGALPQPLPVSADATDLARRVATVLGLLVVPDRRTELLRGGLLPRLSELGGAPVVVPPEREAWVRRHAERMRETLLGDGYAVVGDPDLLLPRPRDGVAGPDDGAVLALAVRLLLDTDGRRR